MIGDKLKFGIEPRKRPDEFPDSPVLRRVKSTLQDYLWYRGARFLWHFASDPIFRRDHLLLWQRPRKVFQHRSITFADRYPRIFSLVQAELRAVERPRLLSFGCANGEEVFSLAHYFPNSEITGIDISPGNIADARAELRRRATTAQIQFKCTDSAGAEADATYDAVFCMAVFVRWQLKTDVATSEPHLRFVDFERMMTDLARAVAPGGFLVLRYSMFRFSDCAVAREFSCVLKLPRPPDPFPHFGRDNRRVADLADEEVMFRRRPSAE